MICDGTCASEAKIGDGNCDLALDCEEAEWDGGDCAETTWAEYCALEGLADSVDCFGMCLSTELITHLKGDGVLLTLVQTSAHRQVRPRHHPSARDRST